MFCYMNVEDSDRWIKGWKNACERGVFSDKCKTRIFRYASVENMQKVTKFLGEKEESKVIKVLSSHL